MTEREVLRKLEVPYEHLRTLHASISEVFHVRNTITGFETANKRISVLGLEETVAYLEATTLQAIEHDNIVRVLDVGRPPDADPILKVIEICMEYLPRGSVGRVLFDGYKFGVAEAVQHMQRALRGVSELNDRHRIIHRDVKPDNLLLADDGSLIKVGDLSLATKMGDDGTAEPFREPNVYVAPDNYAQDRIDARVDVYGAGLTLFEMVNGPFPYDDPAYQRDACSRRLERRLRPVPPRHLIYQPFVPQRLRRVIDKAIHQNPDHRFTSAGAMQAALVPLRLVDWRPLEQGPNEWVWEGRRVGSSWSYRVEVKRGRRGGYRARALQFRTSWRAIPGVEPLTCEGPTAPALAELFEAARRAAWSR